MSCFLFRLAELGREGEKDTPKKARPSQVIQTSLADRFNQLQDAEGAWKKKVSFYLLNKYVIAGRKLVHFVKLHLYKTLYWSFLLEAIVLAGLQGFFFTGKRVVMSKKQPYVADYHQFCVKAKKRLGCGHIYSFAESACLPELLPKRCEVRRAWRCSGYRSGDAKARDPGLS